MLAFNFSKLCIFVNFPSRFELFDALGPVLRRPISANPLLNFNLGFYISLFKSCLRTIFNQQIEDIKI